MDLQIPLVRGLSRLPARSALLPPAEVSAGHPRPLKPRREDGDFLRKRENAFLVRLTDKEMLLLNEKVKKSGLSRERLVRKIISNCQIHEFPPVDFFTLIREINRVGCNIDQILRVVNAKHFIDAPRRRKELDALDKIEDAMWEAFAPDGR